MCVRSPDHTHHRRRYLGTVCLAVFALGATRVAARSGPDDTQDGLSVKGLERVLENTRPARQSLAERVGRAAVVTRAFRRNGTKMWDALFSGNLEKSAFHWQQMGSNLKQMWLELMTSETPEESAGQEV